MRHFLLTDLQAGKLPRWGLLLLCALYALPGFVGRDPWRTDDAAGFGIALTMARGTLPDWLMPNIAGAPIAEEGPLPFWLAGLAARLASPLVAEHVTVRAVAVAGLWLLFTALWYATWMLARRPGLQPQDPFGAAASRVDFGRAIADSGLLVLLATIGLVARLHETTAEAAQVTWIAVFLFGAATSLERGRRGGLIAGAAIAASAATRGLPIAAALTCALLLLPLLSAEYRWNRRQVLPIAVGSALLGSALWPAWLAASSDASARSFLDAWLQWNLAQVKGPSLESLGYLLRTSPWFLWPGWPIAAWAIVRWRSRLGEPVVAVPLATSGCLLVLALLDPAASESTLLPVAPPLAMLAAIGLPTLRRAVVSLIDWFSVMTFTLLGLAVWAYWYALVAGAPARMAYRASQLAGGYVPTGLADEIVLGSVATLAWLLLVRWRVSRQPPMIWRAVVLASAGLVLAWFLLMTLWLQVFNERNTYRELSVGVAAALPSEYRCVEPRQLGLAERASLAYFARLRFADAHRQCDWLLIQDDGPIARVDMPQEDGWKPVWSGSRRGNSDERFRLYRRAGAR